MFLGKCASDIVRVGDLVEIHVITSGFRRGTMGIFLEEEITEQLDTISRILFPDGKIHHIHSSRIRVVK